MSNHPHRRPQVQRTLMKTPPRVFTRTAGGTMIPAIPIPMHRFPGYVCRCRRGFWTRRGYRKHYVLSHVYAGLL